MAWQIVAPRLHPRIGQLTVNLGDLMLKRARVFVSVALVASACVQPATDGVGPGDPTQPPAGVPSSAQEADWAAIVALEDQAKAIAKTSTCATLAQCRTAPVGNRACGGPRYYIAYCSTSTDSAALFRKLDEVARAEDAYNRKYQIASTCEFRMPAPLALSGGTCRMVEQ